ncbi:tail completion protein gp17 [Sansalvadorimonas verongulae]|uniref:tail completion protein gp17 n=1 Tax=Sansalvadorimonas verongulae TaxID=2172824 RepID=UPI0012BD2385|nr:DUF3168 domain-containing protein [Sansalvadorimonas verongulae]MTI13122.1 DUF3168 domain-containing protein [Sansalvadorimonas verongulae]
MIEAGLKKHLSQALSTKVMAVRRGTHSPAVVYNVITDDIEQTLSGHDAQSTVRIQIDCFHNSYKDVKQLEQAVKNALHNHTGPLGGQPCQRVVMETRRDGFDNRADTFRSIMQFAIYQ